MTIIMIKQWILAFVKEQCQCHQSQLWLVYYHDSESGYDQL